MKSGCIRADRKAFGVRAMCRLLWVRASDFYAWLKEPGSHRAQEDARRTERICRAATDSGKVHRALSRQNTAQAAAGAERKGRGSANVVPCGARNVGLQPE